MNSFEDIIKNLDEQIECISQIKSEQIDVINKILDLLEIATESGAAVLMSTHNFPLIRPRKKRFIEINEGRLITQ